MQSLQDVRQSLFTGNLFTHITYGDPQDGSILLPILESRQTTVMDQEELTLESQNMVAAGHHPLLVVSYDHTFTKDVRPNDMKRYIFATMGGAGVETTYRCWFMDVETLIEVYGAFLRQFLNREKTMTPSHLGTERTILVRRGERLMTVTMSHVALPDSAA